MLSGIAFCRSLGYRPCDAIELQLPGRVTFLGLSMTKRLVDRKLATAA